MIVDGPGFVGRKAWCHDVAFIHRRDVWVGQLGHYRYDLIDGGHWSGAGVLAGVAAVGVSRCGTDD